MAKDGMRLSQKWGLLALCGAALLGGCDQKPPDVAPQVVQGVDAAREANKLNETILNQWRVLAPAATGCFRTKFSRNWTPDSPMTAELTVQGRMIYIFASAYDLSKDPRDLEQVKHGAECLIKHFRDTESNGFFEVLGQDLKPTNTNKRLYSHAFAVFGFAHAARLTRDERYVTAARETVALMREKLGDGFGGYRAMSGRTFTDPRDYSQNPIMHLFEAQLALFDATQAPSDLDAARKTADFVTQLLAQTSPTGQTYIPELYDQLWKPLPIASGGFIDLGHQFEWAFLLSSAAEKGMGDSYAKFGAKLLNYGLENGFDLVRGATASRSDYRGKITDKVEGYWQQAEMLRAFAHFAKLRQRPDLWSAYHSTREIIDRDLVDLENGGWKPATRDFCKQNCAPKQIEPYHMVAASMELIRLGNR